MSFSDEDISPSYALIEAADERRKLLERVRLAEDRLRDLGGSVHIEAICPQKSERIRMDYVWVEYDRALSFFRSDKKDIGFSILKQLEHHSRKTEEPLYGFLVEVYAEVGCDPEVIRLASEALNHTSKDFQGIDQLLFYRLRGVALIRTGKLEEGLRDLRDAEKICQSDPALIPLDFLNRLKISLGFALAKQGQKEQSLNYLNQVLENPDSSLVNRESALQMIQHFYPSKKCCSIS
jgi:tetratricopeptide (TPR) repeat protein